MFTVENLAVRLGDKNILQNVHFTIDTPGQLVGILGANGSGKTTLLDHSRDQYTAKSSNGSRTGTGDRTEEAGYDDTHDGDAAAAVPNAGIYKIDQSSGDTGFGHDISGKYEKWDR